MDEISPHSVEACIHTEASAAAPPAAVKASEAAGLRPCLKCTQPRSKSSSRSSSAENIPDQLRRENSPEPQVMNRGRRVSFSVPKSTRPRPTSLLEDFVGVLTE